MTDLDLETETIVGGSRPISCSFDPTTLTFVCRADSGDSGPFWL
jgi:hypothetical protein